MVTCRCYRPGVRFLLRPWVGLSATRRVQGRINCFIFGPLPVDRRRRRETSLVLTAHR